MSCYFLIYYGNITFKRTKQVQLFVVIVTIGLITAIIFNEIAVYGNTPLAHEIYCMETTYSRTVDSYIQYIKNIMISDLHREINSLNPTKGFCPGQFLIGDQSFSSLLGLIYELRNSIQLHLSSLTVVEIIDFMLKPSILFVLFTLTIMGITLKSIINTESKKSKERKSFAQLVRTNVLKKQDNKCDHCRKNLTVVDFHHKNGDRSDNRQKNCQALCPNCHAIETRGFIKIN